MLGQFLPADDSACPSSESYQEPEFVTGEVQRPTVHDRHVQGGPDLERSFTEDFRQRGVHGCSLEGIRLYGVTQPSTTCENPVNRPIARPRWRLRCEHAFS